MDWFAVASNGAYPTPTPASTQRAAFASSYGLLSIVAEFVGAVTKYPWSINPWVTNPWSINPFAGNALKSE